jgi:hypothetical protein
VPEIRERVQRINHFETMLLGGPFRKSVPVRQQLSEQKQLYFSASGALESLPVTREHRNTKEPK